MSPVTLGHFRAQARQALADPFLQQALAGATAHFREGRERALAELPDAEALRDHLKAIRRATLARLADHLETFERRAQDAGAVVHWALTPEEATRIVVQIAREHRVQMVVKSKSMTSEEIHLNAALQAAGIQPVETDLGEWIIQLAGESPSHIIAPAVHKTRQQVAELLSRATGQDLSPDDIPALAAAARRFLREKFLLAGMGISGANLAVAETGSIVLVTNEGNGRLVTSAPPVHVAILGIEKIVPTWADAAVWLALLARSATGQPLSVYTSILTGPARPEDVDGPKHMHIILLDNRRSTYVGTSYEEVLQCIRCGACLNVCPVYRKVGGHPYGSPYTGPIGAVISPLLFGLDQYPALPHASTLCTACVDVCPARIDLPRMLIDLRTETVEEQLIPRVDGWAERGAAWVLRHPRWYRWASRMMRWLLRPFIREGRLHLPPRWDPFAGRRLPAPAPRLFRDLWERGDV
ncbi:MAG: iron-sulfur cluster-binding protein [Chloroflexi bacterium]|nr:iron-sulfur cluster-binding protein [Chloroflexota bacterium]